MKFGVVVFPGSSGDQDLIYVLKNLLKQETIALWHQDRDLHGCDFIVLPGGFSYGDYLRSGAIARFSPIMEEVMAFSKKGGPVLGICNGFQILCEAKLLPGVLLQNENHLFVCRNVFVRIESADSILTSGIVEGQVMKLPIAHGQGKYFTDTETLKQLNDNNQILFRYCNDRGERTPAANPNGSLENIAGICNENRNVFGMMPHPERAADDELRNTDGRLLFESIIKILA